MARKPGESRGYGQPCNPASSEPPDSLTYRRRSGDLPPAQFSRIFFTTMRHNSGDEADPLVEVLADLYGVKRDWKSIERAVYKNTDCGAWIEMPSSRPLRVELGCIIEGSEATVGPITVNWNDGEAFEGRFREAVAYVEGEANVLWDAEHE